MAFVVISHLFSHRAHAFGTELPNGTINFDLCIDIRRCDIFPCSHWFVRASHRISFFIRGVTLITLIAFVISSTAAGSQAFMTIGKIALRAKMVTTTMKTAFLISTRRISIILKQGERVVINDTKREIAFRNLFLSKSWPVVIFEEFTVFVLNIAAAANGTMCDIFCVALHKKRILQVEASLHFISASIIIQDISIKNFAGHFRHFQQ